MKDEIEDIGYDNTHLELLILLDFMVRLREKGFECSLDYFYPGLWLITDAKEDDLKEIKEEIINEFHKFNIDVSEYAGRIRSMAMSLEMLNSLKQV
ncbi:hypothetical protein [Acidianus sp. HS-5]|uniref:hypothetical protein n=1 Tax=Acidianus sp. HS-5 TaxID=2886040 RepID=UPI001F475F15|nr:hypothetical protein [Acidianus sp. HS-5]BDC18591.1 hypothetical protein HS5_14810 [Acidianus sp. HS-5]